MKFRLHKFKDTGIIELIPSVTLFTKKYRWDSYFTITFAWLLWTLEIKFNKHE